MTVSLATFGTCVGKGAGFVGTIYLSLLSAYKKNLANTMTAGVTQRKRVNETSGNKSQKNQLVAWGSIWQDFVGKEMSSVQRVPNMAAEEVESLSQNQWLDSEKHPGNGCKNMLFSIQNK